MPKRIVISTRVIRPHAGSSRIALALVEGLSGAGHRVVVVADRAAAADVHRAGGHIRYPLGLPLLLQLGRRLLSREQQLALRERSVARSHADLVISDGDLRHQDVALLHNMMRREVEELGAAADPDHAAAAAAQERALRTNSCRLLVVNSDLTRRELVNRSLCPAERIAVVHPGYDPVQFTLSSRDHLRGSTRRDLGVGDGDVLVAFISSGNFRLRGVEALGESLARLSGRGKDKVRVLSVGSERNSSLLRAALARCGLGQAVIERPRCDHVEQYYHAADLLFHPASFETFGLVVVEAAASGCPVLTSRSVGAAEMFHGEGALAVVDRSDPALFAPLLDRMIADSALRAAIGASQNLAIRDSTWAGYNRRFLAVLGERGLL